MEILRSTAGIFGFHGEKTTMNEAERQAYREAFCNFDWNGNGKISYGSLLPAMRRAGVNPTEVRFNPNSALGLISRIFMAEYDPP